jgi:hypothetical protein
MKLSNNNDNNNICISGIIRSLTCIEKLNVINSQIGLNPDNAAPTAKPAKPASVIGVSITLFGPNLSSRPFDT